MSDETRRIVIVGGGLIGTSCAYYLAARGRRVLVLDRANLHTGCSHGNCGYISPSHVIPLPQPGAIADALRAMSGPDSPLYIKPRFDLAMWRWLLGFAARCNERDMLAASTARDALLASSRKLYAELVAAERLDCEYHEDGLLFVYRTQKKFDGFAEQAKLLQERFHVRMQEIRGDALQEFEPTLRSGLAGAWFFPDDAHVRPNKLVAAWRAAAERLGAEFRPGCEVSEFLSSNGRVRGVRVGGDEVLGDQFILASGALSPRLGALLGARLTIQPGKGYSITMPRPEPCPRYPMIFIEDKVAVTPMDSGYRIGSTMEFSGYDSSLNPRRLQLLRDGASRFLQDSVSTGPEEPWCGWRPMTIDGMPIIDRSPRFENAWIAAGHNMLGLSMAPATGRLVAEMISGDVPHLPIKPYSATRFGWIA